MSRRPEFYNTSDIPGSRPGTQGSIGGKSNRSSDPLNPSYTLAKAKKVPLPAPRFLRDAMDVSDIVGARPTTVGCGFRCNRGGSSVIDWTRAHQEGKKENKESRPPTGASSASDIKGSRPSAYGIYRAGSGCDWGRARAAEVSASHSVESRSDRGGEEPLGPSRIASSIQDYVIDPAGSPSRENLRKGLPRSNKVEGQGTFDVFGRPIHDQPQAERVRIRTASSAG
eukprot:CAMPEP_0114139890 /NCGR_PEP_ID=MMETSP0043_2-20121206/17093_1 /TAXON_ID=464988 /ORGANISM="Hemiselmis andersenii, Strain CCMP644" /LENGTH=225 /DNA_ID=CAMNT_0001233949 /DNA_START=123 /DNA_END=797 /DNA_ORIENTATION=-